GADFRADIWSIGAVLYCALTGRPPHAEITMFVKLIAAICAKRPPPLRQLAPWGSPEAARIVERAMGLDPSQRVPTVPAMLDALRTLLPEGFTLREEMSTPPYPSCTSHPSASLALPSVC